MAGVGRSAVRLLLTDVLRCPRCGPEWGLILLAERIDNERRIEEGRLGCANCRNAYPIEGGVLDLRLEGTRTSGAEEGAATQGDGDTALRLAALLGLAVGGGRVALRGIAATVAPQLAALVPEVEVVELRAERGGGSSPGVDEVLSERGFPFADGALRGVALQRYGDRQDLAEAMRVVVPGARVVVEDGGSGAEAMLRSMGAEILLSEGETVVARTGVASLRSAG